MSNNKTQTREEYIATSSLINNVSDSLRTHCEKNIIPQYTGDEDIYVYEHINAVIDYSLKLADVLHLNDNICYAIAVYHELGNDDDDTDNNYDVFMKVNEDRFLLQFFTDDEISIIASACKEHIGNSKNQGIFTSLYSKVLADANTMSLINIDYSMKFYWNEFITKHKDANDAKLFDMVYNAMKNEYGIRGKANLILKASYDIVKDDWMRAKTLLESKEKTQEMFLHLVKFGLIRLKNDGSLQPNKVKRTMLVEDEEEIINENFLFSKKDYYYNFEDWVNDKTNLLFILGLSGSGKTTISKKLAEKHNATLIEMDKLFDWDKLHKENEANPDEFWFERACDSKTLEIIDKYKNSKKKVIIEGVYPLFLQYPEDLKDYSIIILRKSVLASSLKAVMRDRKKDWIKKDGGVIKYFFNRLDINKYSDDSINFTLDVLNESSEKEILTEATKKNLTKREKIEALIYKVLSTLDVTGINVDKYKKFFGKMSDEVFNKYMKAFLKDEDENFYLEILPNKNEPSLVQIKKALDILKVPTDEYVYLRHDGHKDDPIRTAYKVAVGYTTIKRVQQILSKKNTYSLDIAQRNMKNGQVTGGDKIARISDIESYSLVAIGADNALKEFLGPRADNSTAKVDMYKDINLYGYTYLKDMGHDITENQTLNTIYIHLLGAGLSNDLLKEDTVLDTLLDKNKKK